MDSSKLETASKYINNLLLARGLLRNGTPIEFAQLQLSTKATAARPKGDNDTVAAQVINLVHDLILRKDRDQDHNESLSHTLRTLRAEAARNATDIERLHERNTTLTRELSQHQSNARAAQSTASTAEASAKTLRDELARTKTLLQQVRTQCANDVRKRDIELQKLKGHLAARQRGDNRKTVAPSITITPGKIGRGGPHDSITDPRIGENGTSAALEDAEYSLKQETTEFLTQLSQGLSDENDALISLIRNTVATLRELQGLEPSASLRQHPHSGPSRSAAHASGDSAQSLTHVPPTSYNALSAELNTALEHLTSILTNPSFAPIEDVQVREEEIQRLRSGWEKMESRWQEAIVMMQGWRRRMIGGGGAVNLAELRMGLRLGEGLQSPSGKAVKNVVLDDGLILSDEDDGEEEAIDDDELPLPELPDDGEDSSLELEPPILGGQNKGDDKAICAAGGAQKSFPLRERSLNDAGRAQKPMPAESRPTEVDQENLDSSWLGAKDSKFATDAPPVMVEASKPVPEPATAPSSKAAPEKAAKQQGATGITGHEAKNVAHNGSTKKTSQGSNATAPRSKITKARAAPPPQPQLTVAEKLALAETQARRASSSSSAASLPSPPVAREVSKVAEPQKETVPPAGNSPSKPARSATQTWPRIAVNKNKTQTNGLAKAKHEGEGKRTVSGVASQKRTKTVAPSRRKRKSTLTPDELEELMRV